MMAATVGLGRAWEVNREIDFRSEAFAQHLHVFDGACKLGAGLHPLEEVGKLELEPRVRLRSPRHCPRDRAERSVSQHVTRDP
jgi:hypothetical protein